VKPLVGNKSERPWSQLLGEKLPFLVLSAASCILTIWAQHSGESVAQLETLPVGDRMTNAAISYVRYIGKMIWPAGLSVFYPHQSWPAGTLWCAILVLLGISGVVAWRARREPYLTVGWLWYVGTMIPVIGLVQVGSQAMADRYTYVPLIGLFIMVAWGVPRWIEQRMPRRVMAVAATTLVGLSAVLARFQVGYWKNSETLFRHALEVNNSNWMAHNNLALALCQEGRIQDALVHLNKSLQIRPDFAEAHNNLGNTLLELDKVPEAVAHFEQALRLKPNSARAHYNFGGALIRQGKLSEAIGHWEQAVRINPDYAEAHNNLAVAFMQSGRLPEAVEHFKQALRINVGYADAHNNLGVALMQSGRLPEAMEHFKQALRINPDYAQAHYNLGVALEQTGRLQEAIGHYEKAVRIKPDYPEARSRLSRLRAGP
jgi:tetratricopeptide (TPR) repeat protein